MTKEKQYRYSEIFKSIQGEGKYTGIPTLWYRAWGCNFNCDGFGQEDPKDPETWDLPYETIQLKDIDKIENLPVFSLGCDSSYSWSKRFRHLAPKDTAKGIVDSIEALMTNEYNPYGKFAHPKSQIMQHMAFTGVEPMMSQHTLLAIYN